MNRWPVKTERLFRLSLAVWGLLILLFPSGVRGGVWTNAAGNTLEATLLSLDHGIVAFQRADGSRFDMSLASLSAASQQQVLDETGQVEVPERLRASFGIYVRTLARLEELRRAGKIGAEEITKQSAVVRAQFEQKCSELEIPMASRERLLRLAQNR